MGKHEAHHGHTAAMHSPPPSPAGPSTELEGGASGTLAFGLFLIVLGCLSSAIGMALMKQSGDVEDSLPLHLRWRWMLGFVFLVVNATILDLIAYVRMSPALSISYCLFSIRSRLTQYPNAVSHRESPRLRSSRPLPA